MEASARLSPISMSKEAIVTTRGVSATVMALAIASLVGCSSDDPDGSDHGGTDGPTASVTAEPSVDGTPEPTEGTPEPTEGTPEPVDEPYAQYVSVIDDWGLMFADVPVDWSDLNTAPTDTDGRGEKSQIMASTDLDAFADQFFTGDYDTPGVQLVSIVPPMDDVTGQVRNDSYGLASCDLESVESGPFLLGYDQREYVGEIATFVDCGGTSSQLAIMLANPADGGYHTLYMAAVLVSQRDADAVVMVLATLSISDAG